jgi:ribosome recycling factor
MDSTAFSLCLDNHVPILVLDLHEEHAILRGVTGKKVGTLVHAEVPPNPTTPCPTPPQRHQAKMKKAVDHTLHEFASIHTGKATPAMVEGVMVEAYGSQMRLKECAAITTPDARMIQIQPWDAGLVKAIEKAIQVANLGFNPIVDGKIVRIPLPDMSRERRQEFVKTAHRLAEEGRVHVRNVRRDDP